MRWTNSCNGAGCGRNHKSAGKVHKRAEDPGGVCGSRAGAAGSGMNMEGLCLLLVRGRCLLRTFHRRGLKVF